MSNKRGRDYTHGSWIQNGIDRKDDGKAYDIKNCVPCCSKCNYSKQGQTDEEFFAHVEKIYKHHFNN
jgi:hypothetical protein